jgi:hypothetical protein
MVTPPKPGPEGAPKQANENHCPLLFLKFARLFLLLFQRTIDDDTANQSKE